MASRIKESLQADRRMGRAEAKPINRVSPTRRVSLRSTHPTLLLLKTMLAVPVQKVRMWPIRPPLRLKCATALVDYRSDTVQVVRLTRYQYFQIVPINLLDRDKTSNVPYPRERCHC